MSSVTRSILLRPLTIVGLVVAILATGCESGSSPPTKYVLVHGSFQGPWAWTEVAAGLRAGGAIVQTVELPGHGTDRTPPGTVTLDSYVSAIENAIDALGPPVVLVGHSMGGMPVTAVAEKHPGKVSTLVYLAAYLPQSGQSLLDLALTDAESHLGPKLAIDMATGEGSLPADQLKDIFCADCSEAQGLDLVKRYRHEPLPPFGTPVTTSEANWGAVPKLYIHTRHDNAVSFGLQKRMVSGSGLSPPALRTVTLDTGHCPFLTAPQQVVDALTAR